MSGNKCCTRICAPALGIALGLSFGLYMMLAAWAGWLWNYGSVIVSQYSVVFYGYAPTLVGGFVGGVWGLIQGFVFGIVIGWIYNCCARGCGCGSKCPTCCNDKSAESCNK